MTNRLYLLLHLLAAFSILLVSAKIYETDDAIIVEGKCKFISFFLHHAYKQFKFGFVLVDFHFISTTISNVKKVEKIFFVSKIGFRWPPKMSTISFDY